MGSAELVGAKDVVERRVQATAFFGFLFDLAGWTSELEQRIATANWFVCTLVAV